MSKASKLRAKYVISDVLRVEEIWASMWQKSDYITTAGNPGVANSTKKKQIQFPRKSNGAYVILNWKVALQRAECKQNEECHNLQQKLIRYVGIQQGCWKDRLASGDSGLTRAEL